MEFIERIAMVCHEVNRIYCESIGDNSQPGWAFAPDWQKKSAINGVKFHIDNPNSTPKDSHKSWLKEKEKNGWKYGPKKDVENKLHPCMIPYDELPENQKIKDSFFTVIVKSFL